MSGIAETVSKANLLCRFGTQSYFIKCLGEIGDYVVDMLCTD